MPNGPSRHYKGGILLITAVTVVVMSALLLFFTDDLKITANFSYQTQCIYKMKIMKELFLTDYFAISEEKRPASGEVTYTTGSLMYECQEKQLKITTIVDDYQRVFNEKLPIATDEITESDSQLKNETNETSETDEKN